MTHDRLKLIDTFTVKSRKVGIDSLTLKSNQQGSLSLYDPFYIEATTPIVAIDSSQFSMMDKDSVPIVDFTLKLDSLENKIQVDFKREADQTYKINILPDAITDFFGETNDTLNYSLSTKSLTDFGNLRLQLDGAVQYPIIVQLTDEKGQTKREIAAETAQEFVFNTLEPTTYMIRVIFDSNGNQKWDTGNYLKKIQPERVSYYPDVIEMRANWEFPVTFTLLE
ncbi:hypothetical protein [Maribacter halichondriae]|uniref:hypothetical protein n=1 Tax=Maribacter halichondriae TaxID=2980554 RepID=UPI0030763639